MARTIFRVGGGTGFLAGRFQRGRRGDGAGSIRQIVSDGDTVSLSSDGTFPVRFLGIDTAETRIPAPDTGAFTSVDAAVFRTLLADPMGAATGPMTGLTDGLVRRLSTAAGTDAAATHLFHAKAAEDALEAMIAEDFAAPGVDSFFLAFAFEALDGFGRLLAYVHPSEPDTPSDARRRPYNERMLALGQAYPYFIFPNVDPFRSRGSPVEAAALARSPEAILAASARLRRVRDEVARARAEGQGVWSRDRPNPYEPFELRYVARRAAPTRWVLDLSRPEAVVRPPAAYVEIPNAEDRLWIPEAYVPLLEATGWRVARPATWMLGTLPADGRA